MSEQIELGWLRLGDKSDLVLTSLHVFQYKNRGMLGEAKTIVPLRALTTARISWHRSRVLLAAGILLLVVSLTLVIDSFITGFTGTSLSFRVASLLQYGSLLGAVGLFVLFWFYKRSEIEIIAPTGTIGGIPKSYHDAQEFCDLIFSEMAGRPLPVKKDAEKLEEEPKAPEPEWHL